MNQIKLAIAVAFALLASTETASAALVYSLTPSTANVGAGGGTVTFTGSVIGDAGEQLLAYDVFFDVSGQDLNVGGGPLMITNPTPNAFGPGFFSSLIPGGGGRDFGISNTGLFATADTTGGLDLFTFDVVVAPNAGAPVDYTIDFTPGVPGFSTVLAGNVAVDLGTVTFNGGTISVAGAAAAVPEPSSFAFVSVALVGCVMRRRKPQAA